MTTRKLLLVITVLVLCLTCLTGCAYNPSFQNADGTLKETSGPTATIEFTTAPTPMATPDTVGKLIFIKKEAVYIDDGVNIRQYYFYDSQTKVMYVMLTNGLNPWNAGCTILQLYNP